MSAGVVDKHADAAGKAAAGPVLEITGLCVGVRGEDGEREVVSGLSLSLERGETLENLVDRKAGY